MLNRRHIRIKVLQTIYAMQQSDSDNFEKEEKFLANSMDFVQDLYLIMVSALVEIRKKEVEMLEISRNKHLATKEELNPNYKLANNKVLLLIESSKPLSDAMENRKITNWKNNDDYIILLLNAIKESYIYQNYMQSEVHSFEEDRKFVMDIFSKVIAPNEKLHEYLEDLKLTWTDDYPLVNTSVLKSLKLLKDQDDYFYNIPKLFRDEEDREFAFDLFKKTILHDKLLAKEFVNKTPNWDSERISQIDTIMLKMAICEFLKFPTMPLKVTINEYLEIAKEYSTPKSSNFINGILDSLIKENKDTTKIKKVGKGLL